MVVVPVMNSSPGLWVETNEATLQLSDGVGAVHVTDTEHEPALSVMVILSGHPSMTGSSSSETTTSKVQTASLPQLSTAVYVTVVGPSGKNEPGVCDSVGVRGPSHRSDAVGAAQLTTAPHWPESFDTAMFEGQPGKLGGVKSTQKLGESKSSVGMAEPR